jgi:ubiquitin carboxyl-terminal hydrolase 25
MLIRTLATGKTAPRLINDLLDHDPRYSSKHGRNLLVDPAPRYRGTQLPPRKSKLDCRHTLMKKEHQTNAPLSTDEHPDESTEYKVAAYCSTCQYHFDITIDFWPRKDRQTPCNLSDEFNPLHHLRLVKSTNSREHIEKHGVNKYYPLTEAHRFVCSGAKCPLVVDIRISPPRLSNGILSDILDTAKLEARGRREIKNDPDRYQGLSPIKPVQALGFLRQYLYDAKGAKSRTELKKIARRNKKYMLTFADECDELFEYLDFIAIKEASPEPEVSV